MKPKCSFEERTLYNEFAFNFDRLKLAYGMQHYKQSKINVENKIFFSTLTQKDDVFHHWIHFYGSPIEARNYSYTLEYINDAKTPKVTCGRLTSYLMRGYLLPSYLRTSYLIYNLPDGQVTL